MTSQQQQQPQQPQQPRQPLTANRLLAELDPADLELLIPHLHVVSLGAGKVLQEPEEPAERVWFPLSGLVSVVAVTATDAMVEIAVVGREGVLNSFLDGPWNAPSRTIVQIDGAAAVMDGARLMDGARFRDANRRSEQMRAIILRYKELMLAQAQQLAACNAIHSLEQRLARWLLEAQDRVQDNSLRLTQEFLSFLLGVRRTSVTHTATKLHALGLIRPMRGGITITNRAGLEAEACECYATLRRREATIFPRGGGGR
jgi:CRP-like cAMP-binding protein